MNNPKRHWGYSEDMKIDDRFRDLISSLFEHVMRGGEINKFVHYVNAYGLATPKEYNATQAIISDKVNFTEIWTEQMVIDILLDVAYVGLTEQADGTFKETHEGYTKKIYFTFVQGKLADRYDYIDFDEVMDKVKRLDSNI